MEKRLNWIIAVLFAVIAVLLFVFSPVPYYWGWGILSIIMSCLHIKWASKKTVKVNQNSYISVRERVPNGTLTELVLLGENNEKLTSWNIYGKNGLVIGRDIGENQVDINLDETIYASMISKEHAVLNFSGNDWYIEDISASNGVSIQKRDGRKYKLAYGKPCKLEQGDIIYIALTKLQII